MSTQPTGRTRPLIAAFAAATLAVGTLTAPAPAGADETATPQAGSHTATPAPARPAGQPWDNVRRGHGMEREHVGITVAADAIVEARTANQTAVTLNLMADDHTTDKAVTLPASGEWVRITPEAASTVFVRSAAWNTAPVIEYRTTGDVWQTPVYRHGDDEAAFIDEWETGGSPFALVEDDTVTIHIPRIDLPRVKDWDWSGYDNLDEVIDGYRHLIDTYDEWLGLTDADPGSVHHNHQQRPFIRADGTGWGLAYYFGGQYVGTNINSVHYYLQSPTSWLTLHEIGHGYDGMMTGGNGSDMHLGEVWNNVYAYLYQTEMHGMTESNWLNGAGIQAGQEGRDNRRQAAGGTIGFNTVGVNDRLDVLTRILDVTGTEAFTSMNRTIRELRTADGFTSWPSRTDLVAQHWGHASGVNVLPWLELHELEASSLVDEFVYDTDPKPAVVPLSDIVTDNAAAFIAADRMGVDSTGALVTSAQVAAAGLTGHVTVSAPAGTAVDGRQASLFDGATQVAVARFVDGRAVFGDVAAGVYTLRLPADAGSGVAGSRSWLVVEADARTEVTGVWPASGDSIPVAGSVLTLSGLGNSVFGTIEHDTAADVLRVSDFGGAPHSYYEDREYAHVTVTSAGGEVVFDRSFVGAEGRDGIVAEFAAEPGATVEVSHAEFGSRLKMTDMRFGTSRDDLNPSQSRQVWTVTKHGLALAGAEGLAESRFVDALRVDLERLSALVAEFPQSRLEVTASALSASLASVPPGDAKDALVDDFGPLLEEVLAPATDAGEPSPEPTQEPTQEPTTDPTQEPTEEPTEDPTQEPTTNPTEEPTEEPTTDPTVEPTQEPTTDPTVEPTQELTGGPTEEPTEEPTGEPTGEPTKEPTEGPTQEPTTDPTEEPTEEPTQEPTDEPAEEPTEEPTQEPTQEPTEEPTQEPTEAGPVDVYTTPGLHHVNGRDWFTSCEPYSQTIRCRTEIIATKVQMNNGAWERTNGWVFNNLTYLPKMKRSAWNHNPLGYPGEWTDHTGRRWETECDTPATGRGGCRTYVETSVIESYLDQAGNRQHRTRHGVMVFNNIVRFSN